ncbi:conserved Plasmodium protein, unknown function [Babesia microti strain RI]|uniref:Uncharacterized protein n=1 Tax=Babesia microti (strain RI) TaxID=1133968 RepID=I7J864_BABMR|nr:conserved Plasmodium protein, unknown function [Babesia microti strain RI]CCF75198.1 conserved Plasmodium protein, unknown function [Babesia microti strain RI]|eukprot:XP_012649606.1 conserved Plasmodium protein, unknown function [Babesia microti strain RI]
MDCPSALQPIEEPCLVCFEDISSSNFVAYQLIQNGPWYPAKFCIYCIKQLLDTMFDRYVYSLENSNCAKEQRALLDAGPPINIIEKHAFPEACSQEVYLLWDYSTNTAMSAKLKNSLTGQKRLDFWSEKRSIFLASLQSDDEAEDD